MKNRKTKGFWNRLSCKIKCASLNWFDIPNWITSRIEGFPECGGQSIILVAFGRAKGVKIEGEYKYDEDCICKFKLAIEDVVINLYCYEGQ